MRVRAPLSVRLIAGRLPERSAFVACEPVKTFRQRDNRCGLGHIKLVHYAEHRKCLHFFSCRWWGAPEQIHYVGCLERSVFLDQMPEDFGARRRSTSQNVISRTGHRSSSFNCRRPQISACALARLANRQFIRSGFSITGTEWESFSSPSAVSTRYTFIAPRSDANRRAQRAITRRQSSGSFSLSQSTPWGFADQSVRRKFSVIFRHSFSLSFRSLPRFNAISSSLLGIRGAQREKEKPGTKIAHHLEHPRLNRCGPGQQHKGDSRRCNRAGREHRSRFQVLRRPAPLLGCLTTLSDHPLWRREWS